MRKRPLLWFACVFLCGLAFERYKLYGLFLMPIIFIGVEIFYGVKHKFFWKTAGRSLILLSAFLLGMAHMREEENFRDAYMSKVCNDDIVIVWGEIIKMENTDYGVRMILSDCYISLNEENIPCNDILVYASSNHFHVGEIHKIIGQLNLFECARNQGNFDAKTYYQSQKCDFSIWLESSELLAKKENMFLEWLIFLKEKLIQVFELCMDERAAGFFAGMLLGDKSNLEDEIKELFTLGGISHILAISGLHVSMIGRNFYQMLRRIGTPFLCSGLMAGILLLAYGYLVGNSMSAVRAIGMMCIFFFSQCLGRSYDMLNALGAMVMVLLWENPFLLEYSGFGFSVMALMGVGFIGKTFSSAFINEKRSVKKVAGFFKRLISRIFSGMVSGIGMSLGITLTTLPVVAFCYYEIPLYSPLVNAIVLPLLTPIFILALCGSFIGVCFPAFAKFVLMPCEWGLNFYVWLCELLEKLPYASVICGEPEWWVMVFYYAVLFVGIFLIERKEKKNCLGVSIVLCIICFLLIVYPKQKPFEITFLDVGQGDGIYISAGDGTTYFIDGGSTSEELIGEYRILPFLKSKDVSKIDYWFVSHADMDHISGLMEVLEKGYKIEHLIVSKYVPEDENLSHLISVAELCDVQIIYMNAGDMIRSESVIFTCLYPWDSSVQDKNDASLVLKMELTDERKAFFAGDISSEVEQLLLRRGVIDDVWLYKASHHGSKYSNSAELLEILRPEVCVISCSKGNFYGHPHKETIERIETVGSELFYTMENGQVSILLLQ